MSESGFDIVLDRMLDEGKAMGGYCLHGLVRDCALVPADKDIDRSAEFRRLERCCKHGGDVNALSSLKDTALHHATRPEVAKMLLDFSAYIGARDARGALLP